MRGSSARFRGRSDELLIRQEQEAAFMKQLNRLPLAQRSVLLLHFVEEFCRSPRSRDPRHGEVTPALRKKGFAQTHGTNGMKHPREVLFERHRPARPKLDAIRKNILANLSRNRPFVVRALARPTSQDRLKPGLQAEGSWAQSAIIKWWNLSTDRAPVAPSSLRDLLWSFRWHVAGMSAAWVLAALLNADPAQTEAQSMAITRSSPPRQLLTGLRENRRQIGTARLPALLTEPVSEPPAFVPKRRGGNQSTNLWFDMENPTRCVIAARPAGLFAGFQWAHRATHPDWAGHCDDHRAALWRGKLAWTACPNRYRQNMEASSPA